MSEYPKLPKNMKHLKYIIVILLTGVSLLFNNCADSGVLKGDISPFKYGAIIDYDKLKKDEPVLYGTYFTTIDGVRYLKSVVEDFDTINARRKSIGLEPIEQFMEKFNIIYDPNIARF